MKLKQRFVLSKRIQKKWDQNNKADPEKQPALEENDLKPNEGENLHKTNTLEIF